MASHQSGSGAELDSMALAMPSAMSLDTILAELRRLAVGALDGGHPLVAAQIAATADRVEAASWPSRPPRPGYVGRTQPRR